MAFLGLLADRLGLLGLTRVSVSWSDVAGVVLLVLGIWLIKIEPRRLQLPGVRPEQGWRRSPNVASDR